MSDVVLIIGGTTGIGFETASLLSTSNQWKVVVCGLEKVKSKRFVSLQVDIRSAIAVKNLYDEVINKFGDIYGLVYCAGITTNIKPIEQFDEVIWNGIIDTNVTGFLRVIKNFHKSLVETTGRVVVVNSIAGKTYSKYSGFEYTASKAALSGIVRQIAMEWSDEGILINSVFPSMTLTPMLRNNLSSEEIEQLAKELPLKKLADPIDIARTVEFLLRKENQYITGTGINISGGLILNG